MKTFIEYLEENRVTEKEMQLLTEGLQQEWTPELEEKVDQAVDAFLNEYRDEDGNLDIDRFNEEMTNEGLLGSIVGRGSRFFIFSYLGYKYGSKFEIITKSRKFNIFFTWLGF